MPSLSRRPVSAGSDPGQNGPGSRPARNGGRAAATADAPARGPWSAADLPPLAGAAAGPVGATAAPAARATAAPAASDSLLDPATGIVRYRGFLLMPQGDRGWLVRPERSPMTVLPFRTATLPLSDVKALVDGRLRAIRQGSQP